MDDRDWLRTAASVLAAAAIVLVVVNGALTLRNEAAQNTVNERQEFINQGAEVRSVAQLLAQTIARKAVATKDQALVALLARHGLKLKQIPTGAPAAAPAPPAATESPQ